MKKIIKSGPQYAYLILVGLPAWAGAGVIPSTGVPLAIEQRLSVSSTPSIGIGVSVAEEENLPPPTEYKLKPGFIKAQRLTKEQEKALRDYLPEFRQWTIEDYPDSVKKHYPHSKYQLPYAVSGDFDGNDRLDIAIAGHTSTDNIILAIMSDVTGYHVLPIKAAPKDPRWPELDVIFLFRKGIKFAFADENGEDQGPEEVMKHDGIQQIAIEAKAIQFRGRNSANCLIRYNEGLGSLAPVSVSSAAPLPFKPAYQTKLAITPLMEKTVRAFDKDFRMWTMQDYPARITESYPYSEKALPYAVRGDFNGDGIDDSVITGHNADENRILILLSSGTGYSIDGWSDNHRCYLETRKRGKQIPYFPSVVLRIHGKGMKTYHTFARPFPPMSLNSDVFSYQAIYSCAQPTNRPSEDGAWEIDYGDWREVDNSPTFAGDIKMFQLESYHNLRIVNTPPAREIKAAN